MWQAILVTLGAIVVGVAASVIVTGNRFARQIREEARELLANSRSTAPKTIAGSDLDGLPDPVRRYLKHAGIVGTQRVDTVRLRQKGIFRQSPEEKWMPLQAEQYYTTNPPGFVWHGRIRAIPLVAIAGRDMYVNGEGNMLIKLASAVTIADMSAHEANLMRYLNEIMWFPTAFLSPDIRWEHIDDNSARATLSDHGITASAVLHFNEVGELTNFVARRYCTYTGKEETWETPVTAYGERHGLQIPFKGRGVWKLPEGDFSYIELEITDMEYNHPVLW